MAKRGKFIVIDGGEGSGKTTMARKVQELFPKREIVMTREPGGTPYAEEIRTLALGETAKEASAETQFALVWGARHDHLKKLIVPSLQEGKHVVSDRFDSSTYAYQMYGQEAPQLKKLFFEMRKVYLKERTPDLYIFFDVTPEEGLRRAALRKEGVNHFDERRLDFHRRVRKGYLEFLKKVPHVVIKTDRTLEEVQKDFVAVLSKIFK